MQGGKMGGDIWRSREAELVSKYAQRLEPDDLDENGEKKPVQLTPISKDAKDDELELSYINGAPPPDLLDYKTWTWKCRCGPRREPAGCRLACWSFSRSPALFCQS